MNASSGITEKWVKEIIQKTKDDSVIQSSESDDSSDDEDEELNSCNL